MNLLNAVYTILTLRCITKMKDSETLCNRETNLTLNNPEIHKII